MVDSSDEWQDSVGKINLFDLGSSQLAEVETILSTLVILQDLSSLIVVTLSWFLTNNGITMY